MEGWGGEGFVDFCGFFYIGVFVRNMVLGFRFLMLSVLIFWWFFFLVFSICKRLFRCRVRVRSSFRFVSVLKGLIL